MSFGHSGKIHCLMGLIVVASMVPFCFGENNPHFLSFLAGSHHLGLFTLQRYVKSSQTPNTTLLSAKNLFVAGFHNQRLGILKKILDRLFGLLTLGLPFF